MEEVFLTIAIPTYQRVQLLYESLVSVAGKHVSFTYEVLVVDYEMKGAAVVGRFPETANSCRMRYVRNVGNVGMVGNWNKCIQLARGKFVTILHDDDFLTHEFFECIESLFDSWSDSSVMYGFYSFVQDKSAIAC